MASSLTGGLSPSDVCCVSRRDVPLPGRSRLRGKRATSNVSAPASPADVRSSGPLRNEQACFLGSFAALGNAKASGRDAVPGDQAIRGASSAGR